MGAPELNKNIEINEYICENQTREGCTSIAELKDSNSRTSRHSCATEKLSSSIPAVVNVKSVEHRDTHSIVGGAARKSIKNETLINVISML